MKRTTVLIAIIVMLTGLSSCEEKILIADFEDTEDMSILTFMQVNDSLYGRFLKILEAGGINKTLSAYNPYNSGYTLFLPDSLAIEDFINESADYSTFDDLLNDEDYVTAISKYHVVNLGIDANDFPFGALPAQTFSEDFLTVNFVIEEDSSFYKINNQAPVKIANIELSNGYIHVLSKMLQPITFTSYDWIAQNPDFSIFTAAVDATGFTDILDINLKDEEIDLTATTLLVAPDSIFHMKKIYSLQDLVDTLGVEDTDYTQSSNGLYQFVGYHILDAYQFLDDFADKATNYTTYSDLPLNINGNGLDLVINRGKVIFDTIVENTDTTIIDYVGFDYDASNIITQSGSIHIIDQVMKLQQPSRATLIFEFWEEPLITEFRQEPGEYIIDDTSALEVISWTGTELIFVESSDNEHRAWGQDYLLLDGDFSIEYELPKIVQGEYTLHLRAHAFSELNAVVEVFVDGQKIGGLVDLATGGSASWPYTEFFVGGVDFSNYESHVVEVRSLIPGKFEWDYVKFEPKTN